MSEINETPPQTTPERSRRFFRRSLFWPLFLVALGVIFLLRNIGVLSGDAWDNLVRLWPLLLILLGLDSLYRGEGVAGSVFWIGLGLVFLLANLNIFNWNAWAVIFTLWPVLLIAIGLDIVIGRRSTLGAVIAMLIVIAVLAGGLWLIGTGTAAGQALPGESISQSLQGATEARVQIQPAVGNFNLKAMAPGGDVQMLAQGQVRKYRGETVLSSYSLDGSTGVYTLRTSGISIAYMPGSGKTWGWDLTLNPSLPIDLRVEYGAGQANLDLSGLQISALKSSMGVGQTSISLPAGASFRGEISGAIGELVIVVPPGVEARIEATPGLGTTDAASTFIKQGSVYTTPGYQTAEKRIELKASLAIGKITLKVGR